MNIKVSWNTHHKTTALNELYTRAVRPKIDFLKTDLHQTAKPSSCLFLISVRSAASGWTSEIFFYPPLHQCFSTPETAEVVNILKYVNSTRSCPLSARITNRWHKAAFTPTHANTFTHTHISLLSGGMTHCFYPTFSSDRDECEDALTSSSAVYIVFIFSCSHFVSLIVIFINNYKNNTDNDELISK